MNAHESRLFIPDFLRLPAAAAFVALADFIFFDAPFGGLPSLIFSAAFLLLLMPCDFSRVPKSFMIFSTAAFALFFFGMLYKPGSLALFPFLFFLIAFRLFTFAPDKTGIFIWAARYSFCLFTLFFDWAMQLRTFLRRFSVFGATDGEGSARTKKILTGCLLWIPAFALTLVFLWLFCLANPLMEKLAANILPYILNHMPSAERVFLWLVAFAAASGLTGLTVWRAIFAANGSPSAPDVPPDAWNLFEEDPPRRSMTELFLTRSLILLNILFLLQNVMDIEYLWGSVALPDGVTYASYAHRGAYPLIFTALLAGAFTLVAFSTGRAASKQWRSARMLVYIWLGQNMFLTASAILRLVKYVSVYSMTEWRLAAFMWMLLVAAGLALIVVKIYMNRSCRWLFWMNGGAVALMIAFACAFDSSGFIASFNVSNCRELAGADANGVSRSKLDVKYLLSLGVPAFPAVLEAKKSIEGFGRRPEVEKYIVATKRTIIRDSENWRTNSLLNKRLLRYAGKDAGL